MTQNNIDISELFNKDKYYMIKSFRLNKAIQFLTEQKAIVIDNIEEDRNINPYLYFFENTVLFQEALSILQTNRRILLNKKENIKK